MGDNTSWQDRQTNNLTLEELRQWRIESTKDVTRQRKHASTHNRYLKDTIEDIESGERITTKKLEKLVASAKSKAGIDAAELLVTYFNLPVRRIYVTSWLIRMSHWSLVILFIKLNRLS